MKTLVLTLTTNDVAIIQKSLLYAVFVLQTGSYKPQCIQEESNMLEKTAESIRDVFRKISKQCEIQEKQEDAE